MRVTALVLAAHWPLSTAISPSIDSARHHGPEIFLAVHNSMRQWGSSLHHNGMSIFPADITAGTLLYHGRRNRDIPDSFEWLAFEIEHAEAFAARRLVLQPPKLYPSDDIQHRLSTLSQIGGTVPHPQYDAEEHRHTAELGEVHGYLHIYQATRPLRMLYIDGMAAGKTDIGTLDDSMLTRIYHLIPPRDIYVFQTQDLLLVMNRSRYAFDEKGRATELCKFAKQWKIDGFIRMEPGFESLYCDFRDGGLKLVSARQVPDSDTVEDEKSELCIQRLEWIRAASQRYHGIGGGRVTLNYSSMVSAFFYPVNMTNPDSRSPMLPRLVFAADDELDSIKGQIIAVLTKGDGSPANVIDWQGVTDMVVTRYADKFKFLVEKVSSVHAMQSLIGNLLNMFIDYSDTRPESDEAIARCTNYYLQPVQHTVPWTNEDELIHAAIESTTSLICSSLFKARKLFVKKSKPDKEELRKVKSMVRDLMDVLQWPEWLDCGPCQPDQVCFVAMWPFGNRTDHFHPTCRNGSEFLGRNDYWESPRPPKYMGLDC